MNTLKIYLLYIFTQPLLILATKCGNDSSWIEAGEKCYKYIDAFVGKAEAYSLCWNPSEGGEEGATLVEVRNQAEQNFLIDLLYDTHGVIDGVWLGASRVGTTQEFKWDTGDGMFYSNWAPGNPSTTISRKCAKMISESGKVSEKANGLWEDVSCESRNLVVCEKLQEFDFEDLMREVLKLKEAIKEISPIPIGFLYFQIGTEPSPQALWPQYTWLDVSADYAGLFFRVIGEGSGEIGEVQTENSPSLKGVKLMFANGICGPNEITVPQNGEWSEAVRSSQWDGRNLNIYFCNKFQMDNVGEVRPKNTAIKVWKRG